MSTQDSAVTRPSGDELLAKLQKEEKASKRGRLKLFLGFAAGVGKTYEMLTEANRRSKERCQDVVIGYVETHGRKGTVDQIGGLEVVPRKKIEYKGVLLEEMDVDAVIQRNPRWAIVDELAHTNVPGSKHEKRYEDILEILAAGINVMSAMNVQHLESLNDTVQQITSVKVRETVPDWVLAEANEIVTIDITPRALINRLQRGDVYPAEKVPTALSNFFTEGNLSALREIALREVASEVDRSVQGYRQEQAADEVWRTCEKIMVCISPDKASDKLLRRGWRIANRLRASIIAVYVASDRVSESDKSVLESDISLATRLNIKIEPTTGTDVAATLAAYALKNQISQIIIGHSNRTQIQEFVQGSIINKLVRLVRGIDVLIVANGD